MGHIQLCSTYLIFSFNLLPSKDILPISGSNKPINISINVVLPEPDFPTMAYDFPLSNSMLMLSKTLLWFLDIYNLFYLR